MFTFFDWQLTLAAASFVIVTTGTPGPNNLLLLNSGANAGIRPSLPLLLGINNGVVLLIILMLLGLGEIFIRYPLVQEILKLAGCAYLLWLAWKIARSSDISRIKDATNNHFIPMRWSEAVMFQFVNPKVWMMAITAASSFTLNGEGFPLSALILLLLFMTLGFGCNLIWTALGSYIQSYLTSHTRQRYFNNSMALLTAATVFLII